MENYTADLNPNLKKALTGLTDHLNQSHAPSEIAKPDDAEAYLKNNSVPVETWDDVTYGMEIMTTTQAVDTLHAEIDQSDNFGRIEADAKMAQYLLKVSAIIDPKFHQLYWDANEIFSSDARPLNVNAIVGRIHTIQKD